MGEASYLEVLRALADITTAEEFNTQTSSSARSPHYLNHLFNTVKAIPLPMVDVPDGHTYSIS